MKFYESRMVDFEHAEDARQFIGKRVMCSDDIANLRCKVVCGEVCDMSILTDIRKGQFTFVVNGSYWKYIYLLEDLPKPKKDTPLNRMLEEQGRRMVVIGYCGISSCFECCVLRELCKQKDESWKSAPSDIINKAYEILTNEVRR